MRILSTRLRVRLAGVALLAAIPALLAVIYLESLERNRARAETLGDNLRLARLAAATEAAQFDGAKRLLTTVIEFPQLAGNDARECDRILSRVLKSHPGYTNLSVAKADGTVFCSGAPFAAGPVTSAKGKRWFEQVVRTRTTAVGDVRTSAVTGKPSIIVAHPLIDAEGRVQRVVAATIGIDQLEHAISAADIPTGATLTVFDTSGTIIFRTADGPKWRGRKIADLGALRRVRSGAGYDLTEKEGIDGIGRLYATVPIPGPLDVGLYLGLGVEQRVAYAEADRILQFDIAFLVFVSIVAVGAALVGAQSLVLRPIRGLRAVIDRLAHGDLAARVNLTSDLGGIGELVDGVNAMATALNVRERERDTAESLLRASEDRYRLMFEQNPNAMWVFDTETLAFLEVNDAAVRNYEYAREEFLSMRLTDIRPPDDIPKLHAELAQMRGGAQPVSATWRHCRKSGAIMDVETTAHSIVFNGRAAYLVVAHDISDRTRAENALREAEERMRFALTASRVGVWEANLRTGVSTWSETCEVMHGLEPGSFGRNAEAYASVMHPHDRARILEEIEFATRAHLDTQIEYRTLWPDGTVRRISSAGRFFYDADGTPIRGAGVTMDVTDQRSIEEQLRQSQKMEAVGLLAGGIAHDFNNLLTVISGNVEFAAMSVPDDSSIKVDLDEVRNAALRAAQLTRQLLAFGRKQTLRSEPIDVDEMAEQLAPMLRRLIGEDITVECSLSGESPFVVADRAQLEQVVINLAVNARDAMPQGGTMSIETSVEALDRDDITRRRIELEPGSFVALRVRDTGIGMSSETLARAFEPFFTTKDIGKGTGLGLSSVYGTVKQSGGWVSAESIENAGTTITILLPLAHGADVAKSVATIVRARTAWESATILLVEDDDAVRTLAARVLTMAGFTMLVADSAAAAIDIAREYDGDIALVLSDVVMPGMSGPDMIAVVESIRPGIGVLLMSGYPDAEIGRRGVRTQTCQVVEKPFTQDTLIAQVRQRIAEHRAARRVA